MVAVLNNNHKKGKNINEALYLLSSLGLIPRNSAAVCHHECIRSDLFLERLLRSDV